MIVSKTTPSVHCALKGSDSFTHGLALLCTISFQLSEGEAVAGELLGSCWGVMQA